MWQNVAGVSTARLTVPVHPIHSPMTDPHHPSDAAHRRVPLRVVPEPEPGSRAVLRPGALPAFVGNGTTDMVCGQCGTVLVRGIAPEEWKLVTIDGLPVIVLCSCGGFNEIPAIRPIK